MAQFDFIEVLTAAEMAELFGESPEPEGFWAVTEGHDGVGDIIEECFPTRKQAETAGRQYKRYMLAADTEWRNEAAHQAGMSMGCDAYNDFMGY